MNRPLAAVVLANLTCACVVGPASLGVVEGVGSESDTGTSTTGAEPSPPEPANLELSLTQVKQFDFTWEPATGAEYYQLLERVDEAEDYVQVGGDIVEQQFSITVPLHFRANASYILRACNELGCTDSDPLDVDSSLVDAIGYFKASNPDEQDFFGRSVALSEDGRTLAVGATYEQSNATGIDGDQNNNDRVVAGAVYVFARDEQDEWSQQAYVKASNTGSGDSFGYQVALSADGDTLAVGAPAESSSAVGVDGEQDDDTAQFSGAVYLFARDEQDEWTQMAYVKASNSDAGDRFGVSVALSADGRYLAVGAQHESSNAAGIDGDQDDNSLLSAGAVYVFVRDAQDQWAQDAYIKASNSDGQVYFGWTIALSENATTMAVGTYREKSNGTGVGGDQQDQSTGLAGAVYVFTRDEQSGWAQQEYIKSSNTAVDDRFGIVIALSGDGNILAVGAVGEDSSATGIGGDQSDDAAPLAGAVYMFARDDLEAWTQTAYIKAPNTEEGDGFGRELALTTDGKILFVGAPGDDSNATGVGGDSTAGGQPDSGAIHVLASDAEGVWSYLSYVKAPVSTSDDGFGGFAPLTVYPQGAIAVSGDGATLAIAAPEEDGSAAGVGGDSSDDSLNRSGAVYLY